MAPESKAYRLAAAYVAGRPEELRAAIDEQPTPIAAAGLIASVLESARGFSMNDYRAISYQVQKWGGWY